MNARNQPTNSNHLLNLDCERLENRMMLSTVQLFASGSFGGEEMQLQIDGVAAQTWTLKKGSPESFSFTTDKKITADQVRVAFLNDHYDPEKHIDLNLRLDAIEIDGERFETEDPSVFSTGTWTPEDGVVPGNRQSEFLHTNGYFQFGEKSKPAPEPDPEPNKSPSANDDSAATESSTPVMIDVLANDFDADGDAIDLVSVDDAQNGSVEIVDGKVIYTPNSGFSGNDQFTYTITDSNKATATATVNILVNAPNSAPIAVNDSASTDESTPVTINVLGNDSDPEGDNLSIVSTTDPGDGSVALVGGQIVYTPNSGFIGTDQFTYTIEDGNGGSATAMVAVDVKSVNAAPVAVNDSATTDDATPVMIDVLPNDSDPDAGDSISIISQTDPLNGSVSLVDGKFLYTPNSGFVGNDSFTYTIADASGATSTATVTIAVSKSNDAPVAVDDSVVTDENTSVVVNALANDSDPNGDNLIIVNTSQGANGSVEIFDGAIVYTPNSGFVGTDQFTYTIEDGDGASATATVNVTINNVNEAPVANDDFGSTDNKNSVAISVLDNDSDGDGDALNIVDISNPANGTVKVEGNNLVYTPNTGFVGKDTFTYTIADKEGAQSTATVNIDISQAPTIADGNIIQIGNERFGSLLTNFNGKKVKTTRDTGTNTQWRLFDNGDGTYKLQSVETGQFLGGGKHRPELTDNSKAFGTNWRFDKTKSGGYNLFNTDFGRFVDANGRHAKVKWDHNNVPDDDDIWNLTSVH